MTVVKSILAMQSDIDKEDARFRSSLSSANPGRNAGAPRVRNPTKIATDRAPLLSATAPPPSATVSSTSTGPQSASDSTVGAKSRSGRDYYDAWDRVAEAELKRLDLGESAGEKEGELKGVRERESECRSNIDSSTGTQHGNAASRLVCILLQLLQV
jgi:hypothetical protein